MYNLGEAVGYIRLEMGRFLQDAQQAQTSTKQIEDEFGKLGNTAKSIEGIIVKSFAAIGAAVVSGLGAAVNVGSQFEASMSQVAATMGMTAEDVANGSADFEKLSAAAKEMGETTKFSASQAADALNYLALAGYDTEQAISTLPTVLNLAASGGMDLARASDMITDAASALGLSIDDMSLFADKMAKAAQSSNTSVEQLGNAILQIGGTAKNLSGGVTELNTALGILANNGIKSAEGGTALRQIILNLTAPTEKAAAYMEELGLKVADAAGNVRPLNEIFKDLDEILQSKGITGSADKIKALSQIFDARQLKSANALLANYGESWDRLYEKIDNAEGASARMAETMETNLKGALTILGSTAEGFGITVYESIESSFKDAVQEATNQLSNLNDAFKSDEMQASMQKISDAISDAIIKLSEFLSDTIPKLVSGLSDLIDNFDKISAGIAGLATTIGLATAGMALYKIQTDLVTQSLIAQKIAQLAANAAALANPYTLVAVGIGILVGALVNEYNQQQENIRQLDELNQKYYDTEAAVNTMADNYDKEIEKAKELENSRDNEINQVNELLSLIERNVDESGNIISNTEMVKDAIDELNSIIPVNIQYQGNQITNYAELTQASKDYCEQLKNQAILEARQEEYKAAAVAYDTAIKERDAIRQNLQEASDNYQKYIEIKKAFDQGYFLQVEEVQKEAEAAGMKYSEYVEDMAITTRKALDSATDAYAENERIIRESSETLKSVEIDIVNTQNEIYAEQLKTGQEVTGIFKTESEARIGVAQLEAERLAEIARQGAQSRVEATKSGTDDVITAEEELESALEQLEIDFNTGVIASDEEYHRRRLELLENFHGEWSKKTSQWLKQEKTYIEQQRENELKEQERQQKERERQREETERLREKEQREAEQAAKEKERLYKQETQTKIDEIDRRKKRDKEYTDEQYIADLTALRDTIDKKNELWQQLDDKIFDYQEKVTENAKKEYEQQIKDAYQALKDRKSIEENYSNENYLKDLKTFQSTLNIESDLYNDVLKEIKRTEKEITKEKQNALKQQNEDTLKMLKERKEIDDKYNNEMYLSDLQAFQSVLNKESDIYKEVAEEINKVNKQIKDDTQKSADTAFKTWESGFKSLKTEAENSYNTIVNKQKNLENTLNSQINLYETKTKKVLNLTTGLWEDTTIKKTSTSYLKEQVKELETYQKSLERLQAKGVSDELMQQILGMDEESAKEYVAQLNSMSADSLEAYDEAYKNLKAKNKEFSEKYYADEVEAFKENWGNKIQAYIDSLPDEAKAAAKEIVESFVNGLNDTDFNENNDAFENIFSSLISDFNNNVESGDLFKNYGTKSVKNLENEIKNASDDLQIYCVDLGKSIGGSFADGMEDENKTLKDKAEKWVKTIKTTVQDELQKLSFEFDNLFSLNVPKSVTNSIVNPNIANNRQIQSVDTALNTQLTKDDIKNAIKESLPSGDVNLNIDGNTFAKITKNQLNFYAQQNGGLGLQV